MFLLNIFQRRFIMWIRYKRFHVFYTEKISSWNFTDSSVNQGYNGIFVFFIIILWTNKVQNCKKYNKDPKVYGPVL